MPDQAALRGVGLSNVVRGEERFVAAGDANGRTFFVHSTDGITWERGANLDPEAIVASLAAGPGGFVGVGTIAGHPASWTSGDGLAWTARTDPLPMPPLGSDTATVTGVIADGDGWVVIGRADPACQTGCGLEPVRALVWTARPTAHDSWKWVRVPDQPALAGGGMESIARNEKGFVATGIADRHAAAWTSSDGTSWRRVPDAQAFHVQPDTPDDAGNAAVGMDAVAAGHGVVVGFGTAFAVGPGGAPAAVVWWSPDGSAWTAAPLPDASPDYANGLMLTVDGFLATGRALGAEAPRPIVWRSTEGRNWVTLPAGWAPDGFAPVAVVATAGVELAVGPPGASGPIWWRPRAG